RIHLQWIQRIEDFPPNIKTYTTYLQRIQRIDMAPLPHRDLRHPWLMYQVKGYDEGIVYSYEQRLKTIWGRAVNQVRGPLVREFMLDFFSTGRISDTEMELDVADTLCFRCRMTWRRFILALGLHTEEEMAEAGVWSILVW
ncbi:hypothetical protein Tco_0080980, partial [Tanacetum coccineum]